MLRLLKMIDWHSNKTWGIIGLVSSVFLGIFLQPYITRETPWLVGNHLWQNADVIVVTLVFLLFVFLMIRQRRELRGLRKTMSKEEAPKFRRFEEIKSIRYGHLPYRPLLYYDGDDIPQGIGMALLNRIFSDVEMMRVNRKALWSDLVANLAQNKYDVVATPIFETRERSRLIGFSSPMFYSEIGMYVKKDSRFFGMLPPNSLTFQQAIENAGRMKPRSVAIQGEISGKLALKYLNPQKEDVNEWPTSQTASVNSLINAVLGTDGPESEVVFAEVFQAEHTKPVKDGIVINILKRKQLLYPVCFAMRKSDYVLKNYVNLRLLEIEEKVNDGILGIILEELRRQSDYSHFTMTDVKRYFVRDLDPEALLAGEDHGDAHALPADSGVVQVKSFLEHKRKPDPNEKENRQSRVAKIADGYA